MPSLNQPARESGARALARHPLGHRAKSPSKETVPPAEVTSHPLIPRGRVLHGPGSDALGQSGHTRVPCPREASGAQSGSPVLAGFSPGGDARWLGTQ